MKPIELKRILVATDFLESSRLALDYAVALAHHFNAALILLHAIELSPFAQEAEGVTRRPSVSRRATEERLEAFASGVRRTGLTVTTLIEDGTPCQVIFNAVQSKMPDLLVLGVHGVHRGVAHLVIGSNTEKILLTVTCPTLSVGAHVLAGIDLDLKLNEILYCSDLTPAAAAAARFAVFLGEEFHVPVDVCHLAPTPVEGNGSTPTKVAEDYCEALRRVLPGASEEWCTPAFHLKHSLGLDQILRRAETGAAGLIVLGVHTDTQLGRHVRTSLAYELLTKASCPVLSIRGGRD
jgi:nucleotide-binding universal stress UspA family protein